MRKDRAKVTYELVVLNPVQCLIERPFFQEVFSNPADRRKLNSSTTSETNFYLVAADQDRHDARPA